MCVHKQELDLSKSKTKYSVISLTLLIQSAILDVLDDYIGKESQSSYIFQEEVVKNFIFSKNIIFVKI